VVLRLGGLTFIDSSGVGMLVVLQKELNSRGGRLVLSEVPPQARMALRVTRLEWLLPCFDTLEAAVAA
jgi:anti-anti-sigma factor